MKINKIQILRSQNQQTFQRACSAEEVEAAVNEAEEGTAFVYIANNNFSLRWAAKHVNGNVVTGQVLTCEDTLLTRQRSGYSANLKDAIQIDIPKQGRYEFKGYISSDGMGHVLDENTADSVLEKIKNALNTSHQLSTINDTTAPEALNNNSNTP